MSGLNEGMVVLNQKEMLPTLARPINKTGF